MVLKGTKKAVGGYNLNNNLLNIKTILDIEKWQKIQNELALVTGMAIITVDYKGIAVTKHSGCNEFCEMMRNNPKTLKNCQRCDARGGLEAARINGIYVYRCHCDIFDAAIPIVVDDKYMGAVMVGQIILEENNSDQYLEKIYSAPENLSFEQEKMIAYYNKLPRLSYNKANAILNMIGNISNYIVEEAVKKYSLYEENQELTLKVSQYINKNTSHGEEYISLQNKTDNRFPRADVQNQTLKSAITYIQENLDKKIALNEMAEMCFVSPSYFSKLFYKEIGESFSNYLTNLKINKAKLMLKTTSKTIQEITFELGFNDTSYFIRCFKKHEGVTPNFFRGYSKKHSIESKKIE